MGYKRDITEMWGPSYIEAVRNFGEQQAFEMEEPLVTFVHEGQDCVTPFRDGTLLEEFTIEEAVDYFGFKKVEKFFKMAEAYINEACKVK